MADRASELRRVRINANGIGSTVLIPAEIGYDVVVVSLDISGNGAALASFQDSTGTVRHEAYLAANVPHPMPEATAGWFRTGASEGLDLNLSAAVTVVGCLTYRMVPSHVEF